MSNTSSLTKFHCVRVAAVSPDLRIADVTYNVDEIKRCYYDARSQKAQLIVFPELCVTAYSCGDLFYESALLDAAESALIELAELTMNDEACLVVGAPLRATGQLYNCAAVLSHGSIVAIVPKTYLPSYNEFYEGRWFASSLDAVGKTIRVGAEEYPFGTNFIFHQQQTALSTATSFSFGVEICEDLWATKSPSTDQALAGAQILVNLSASNELVGKADYRRDLVRMQSARCISAYVYCSAGAMESSTDVVFAGHNLLCENGVMLAESQRFRFDSQCTIADIDVGSLNSERIRNTTFRSEVASKEFISGRIIVADQQVDSLLRTVDPLPFVPSSEEARQQRCSEILELQCTALRRRIMHSRVKRLVIGISGGLDSALALLVSAECFDRMGRDRKDILTVSMPGFGSSTRTQNFARELCGAVGSEFREISIVASTLQHFADIQHDASNHNVVYENAQARERTQILMDLANAESALVVGTGDLSEIALGWNTFNGDHMSMYAVNSGIPKTLVKTMVQWLSEQDGHSKYKDLLASICNQPISPELLPLGADGESSQSTEASIGPYELHDFFLYHMLRHHRHPSEIAALADIAFGDTYSQTEILQWLRVFYTRFFQHQFKRSCMPDGPKVGTIALSPRGDWRMPSDAQSRLWLEECAQIERIS